MEKKLVDDWGDDEIIKVSGKELRRILIRKHLGELCQCGYPHHVVIDFENRRLECRDCGAPIDPFEFLKELCTRNHLMWEHLKFMREEKENLEKWMLNNRMGQTLRNFASQLRAGKVPLCPHCHQPFEFENIKSWTSKEYAKLLYQQNLFEKAKEEQK